MLKVEIFKHRSIIFEQFYENLKKVDFMRGHIVQKRILTLDNCQNDKICSWNENVQQKFLEMSPTQPFKQN